jgi:hypothetical protein
VIGAASQYGAGLAESEEIMNAWQTAAIRGIATAVATGALAALTTWSQTDELKVIAVAGLTPFFTILAARFGVEGAVDSQK